MRLEVLKYLSDILLSIEVLEQYSVQVKSFGEFESNMMLVDAVERRLSIIGEALYQANKLDNTLAITDKKKIMGMRHILVHDYDKIQPEILYTIITKNLNQLKAEVGTIVREHPPKGSMTLDD